MELFLSRSLSHRSFVFGMLVWFCCLMFCHHTFISLFFFLSSFSPFRLLIWKVTLCFCFVVLKAGFCSIRICMLAHSKWYIYQNAWPNFVTNMLKLCLREMCGVHNTHTCIKSRVLVVQVNIKAASFVHDVYWTWQSNLLSIAWKLPAFK